MEMTEHIILPTKAEPVQYQLYAIAEHEGPSAGQGHYTAHILNDVGQWWTADDMNVTSDYTF